MDASHVTSVLNKLLLTKQTMPIAMRGDILTLKEYFSQKHLRKWLLAYLLREPQLVSAFFENGWEGVEAAPKKYEYLPRRLISKLSPAKLRALSKSKLRNVERGMCRVIENPTSCDAITNLETAMRTLPGVGDYVCKHFTRTLLLMIDVPHPSTEFIVMGSGASNARYQILLRRHGIHNLAMLHDELMYHFPTAHVGRIDASELAYLICMTKF